MIQKGLGVRHNSGLSGLRIQTIPDRRDDLDTRDHPHL